MIRISERYLTLEKRNKIPELYHQGLSITKIAPILGCHYGTVWYWLVKEGIPRRGRTYFPDLTPSAELSYIIGCIFGDASVFKTCGHHVIHLWAKDRDFVEYFAFCLSKVLGRRFCIREADNGGSKNGFLVLQYSIHLYNFLKNKNLDKFKLVINAFPSDFLRGFFDSEGSVCVAKTFCRVCATSTNLDLLHFVRYLLKQRFGIESRIIECTRKGEYKIRNRLVRATKPCYRLEFQRKEFLIKFAEGISFTIDRKRRVLDAYLQSG